MYGTHSTQLKITAWITDGEKHGRDKAFIGLSGCHVWLLKMRFLRVKTRKTFGIGVKTRKPVKSGWLGQTRIKTVWLGKNVKNGLCKRVNQNFHFHHCFIVSLSKSQSNLVDYNSHTLPDSLSPLSPFPSKLKNHTPPIQGSLSTIQAIAIESDGMLVTIAKYIHLVLVALPCSVQIESNGMLVTIAIAGLRG